MSHRREWQQKLVSFREIGQLLAAMKNMALVDTRRIASFLDAQTRSTRIIERAVADLAADHPDLWPSSPVTRRLVCLIGSERGLCGDLNQQLADAVERAPSALPTQWLLVGSRLVDRWQGPAPIAIRGAGFVDEVPDVLLACLDALVPLLADTTAGDSVSLEVQYLEQDGLVTQRVLPAPAETRAAPRSHPVYLWSPVERYRRELLHHWLEAALSTALYRAMAHETWQRLEHMDQARRRVDERIQSLTTQANRARQEDITQEIELILLTTLAQDDAPAGRARAGE